MPIEMLPKNKSNEEFPNSLKVTDEFRTNSLSSKPGGVTVVVQDSNGFTKEYDKVKFPKAFILKVIENSADGTEAWVKGAKH